MRVIVDTVAWSEFLRRGRAAESPVADEVRRLVRADCISLLGPIRQELLSGARPSDRFAQLKEYLRFFPNQPLDEEDDERAAECYNLCRQSGIQGTAVDLLICAVAIRHGLRIFTLDEDFRRYATVLPIRLHKAGSRIE